uniref:Uncharacterized protein n=1 Tax=viral metagenome TaxID=1070528 RepID=A0A6C0IB85_9ZZZZ
MSNLKAFVTQLIRFFEDLSATFPEERDIKMALEALQGAQKINPRLILDLFFEHVYVDLAEAIRNEDVQTIIAVAQRKITTQFNEMLSALSIFQKHWPTLDNDNRVAIFKYLKVLVVLCEKAKGA